MHIKFIERKGNVLNKPTLKCLSKVAAVNPTLGCSHQCAYCYARGYSIYPGDGTVLVYQNMAEKLKKELPRRKKLPSYIFFSPVCDALQPIPPVTELTFELMETLMAHGIGVNLLTKGRIPAKFIKLFQKYKDLVHVQIGITTMNREIQKKLEPFASTPNERIRNIERLSAIGIVPEVKLDPIIPGITDTNINLTTLFKMLQKYGIRKTGMNYLFLRPQIRKNLYKALQNTTFFDSFQRYYQNGRTIQLLAEHSRIFTLDVKFRKQSYRRIAELASQFKIDAYVCGCKNPDITQEPLCGINWEQHFAEGFEQRKIFF